MSVCIMYSNEFEKYDFLFVFIYIDFFDIRKN